MKRIIFFTIAVFIFSQLHAVEFSIKPRTGFVYGSMNKYIFSSRTEQMLSCLEWETKPLWTAGLELSVQGKYFGVRAAGDIAFPGICGKMHDWDYYYDDEYPSGNACNYSISDNDAYRSINTELGFFFRPGKIGKLELVPAVEAQYTFDSFESKNGHGWYGRDAYSTTGKNESYDSVYAKKVKVLGVEYYRHTFYLWTGLDLVLEAVEFPGGQRLNFTAGLALSPFTYTSSMDHHLSKTNSDYHQMEIEYSVFTRIKWTLKAEYFMFPGFSINAGAQWIYGTLEKGDIYTDVYSSGDMVLSSQKTGADIMQCRASLGCTVKF